MAYETPFDNKPYKDGGKLVATKVKKNEKGSDYFGEIAIDMKNLTGIDVVDGLHVVKLSGWKKMSKSGSTYLSLAVNRFVPEEQGRPTPMSKRAPVSDDDCPF